MAVTREQLFDPPGFVVRFFDHSWEEIDELRCEISHPGQVCDALELWRTSKSDLRPPRDKWFRLYRKAVLCALEVKNGN
jgi:hypothetical protein